MTACFAEPSTEGQTPSCSPSEWIWASSSPGRSSKLSISSRWASANLKVKGQPMASKGLLVSYGGRAQPHSICQRLVGGKRSAVATGPSFLLSLQRKIDFNTES